MILIGVSGNKTNNSFFANFIFDFLGYCLFVAVIHTTVNDRKIITIMINIKHITVAYGKRLNNAHSYPPKQL